MNALIFAVLRFWQSSIGKKLIVAVTGVMLVGFLVAHMAGNLLLYQGRQSINDYAYWLHHFLHGWGIWGARLGLLGAFFAHIAATVALSRQNRAARAARYAHGATVRASGSSRIMIVSGLIVLGFVFFHIFHFTVRLDPELAAMKEPGNPKRHDVYGMVIAGFQNPLVVLVYIVAISLLCSHLSHGVASVFQTLGLRSRKTQVPIKYLSLGLSIVLWFGFLSIPLLVSIGGLEDPGFDATTAEKSAH
ncbi:MAG: succinate dehydrogenase cytochrome b subunit [Verrucomicrobiota bacterium]